MNEILAFVNAKIVVVPTNINNVEDFLNVSIEDYLNGIKYVLPSLLIWENNNLKLIDNTKELCSISIEKWENMIKNGICDKTVSAFINYLNQNFLIYDRNPITADARRGLIAIISTIEQYF